MSAFDPANPSEQQTVYMQPVAAFGATSDTGILDVSGFRILNLSTNVPAALPAGTTIEVDELRRDGNWYPVLPPAVPPVGQQRLFVPNPFADMVRVRYVVPAPPAVFGFTLIGQS